MRFHWFNSLTLYLIINGYKAFVSKRMRLNDVNAICIQFMKNTPQPFIDESRIISSTNTFGFLIFFELFNF